jgi:hypothetical protein
MNHYVVLIVNTLTAFGALKCVQVNKGSSMPRKLRYVAGLRGAPETAKMKVVALELDIGQSHQF